MKDDLPGRLDPNLVYVKPVQEEAELIKEMGNLLVKENLFEPFSEYVSTLYFYPESINIKCNFLNF